MSTGWWEYIDAYRESRGWNQSDLARAAKVDSSVVTGWKEGRQPSTAILRALADGTGIAVLRLMVEAGHLTEEEAGGAVPLTPELPQLDVVSAVEADPELLPEAKDHLVRQYGLLLRVNDSRDVSAGRNDGPGLRAVARRRGDGTSGKHT